MFQFSDASYTLPQYKVITSGSAKNIWEAGKRVFQNRITHGETGTKEQASKKLTAQIAAQHGRQPGRRLSARSEALCI